MLVFVNEMNIAEEQRGVSVSMSVVFSEIEKTYEVIRMGNYPAGHKLGTTRFVLYCYDLSEILGWMEYWP